MRSDLLDKEKSIKHLVSKRDTHEDCDFSMALHTGEEISLILKNRKELSCYFGADYNLCSVEQVHGNEVHTVKEGKSLGWSSLEDTLKADAMITNLPFVVLSILTADCVPVLLYDPKNQAIGAVHAGWRGTKERIVCNTIQSMQRSYGSSSKDILAFIAPAIGGCCYEVDEEVAGYFERYDKGVTKGAVEGKYQLDLKKVNALQMLDAGLLSENIETSTICTACHSDRYFSYRKDRCSGRFISAIALSPDDS